MTHSTIVAGSRSVTSYSLVESVIHDTGLTIGEVVSGRARGVDRLGEQWALQNNVPIEPFPVTNAEWRQYGSYAGIRRNSLMIDYVLNSALQPAIIAIWDIDAALYDNESRGTRNMIQLAVANARKVRYHVYPVRRTEGGGLRSYRASDNVVRELLARTERKRRS